jgi:hypothetical protein
MKHYKIFDKESKSHEYDLKVETNTDGDIHYALYHSHNNIWTHPGEIILCAIDNGNGFTFTSPVSNKISYSDVTELYILLRFIKTLDSDLMGNYEIVDIDSFKDF